MAHPVLHSEDTSVTVVLLQDDASEAYVQRDKYLSIYTHVRSHHNSAITAPR